MALVTLSEVAEDGETKFPGLTCDVITEVGPGKSLLSRENEAEGGSNAQVSLMIWVIYLDSVVCSIPLNLT